MMTAKIVLVLFLILQSGEPHKAEQEVTSMEQCSEAGSAFVAQDPEEFGAKVLGFSCWRISTSPPAVKS